MKLLYSLNNIIFNDISLNNELTYFYINYIN